MSHSAERVTFIYPGLSELEKYCPSYVTLTQFSTWVMFLIWSCDCLPHLFSDIDPKATDLYEIIAWDAPTLNDDQISITQSCIKHAVIVQWSEYKKWFDQMEDILGGNTYAYLTAVSNEASSFTATRVY